MLMQTRSKQLFDNKPAAYTRRAFPPLPRVQDALNAGEIRAAEPDASTKTGWRVNGWVKKGILLGFRMGAIVDMSIDATRQPWFDKATYPVKRFAADRRRPHRARRIQRFATAAIVGKGVTCMPPMYINVGAYVGDGTMVDSHALVGSCAQIGARCHISAAAQIGGVLEPVGALPVIIEDDVLVGGNCGVYEGTVVKTPRGARHRHDPESLDAGLRPGPRRSLLAPRTTSRWSFPKEPSWSPARARSPAGKGKEWGISLYTPVIVKYRDAKTDAKIQLEDLLR